MFTIIQDGRSSQTAEVKNNKLATRSVTESQSKEASVNGDGYNLNTGNITLTSGNKSAVMYIKNTGNADLIIDKIFYILGQTTGGAGDLFIEAIRNPTAGTIVSDAIDADIIINRNHGSNNEISADVYKGDEGKTFTDGEDELGSILTAGVTVPIDAGSIILKKGSSIGFNVTPQSGNTSMVIQIATEVYESQETTEA